MSPLSNVSSAPRDAYASQQESARSASVRAEDLFTPPKPPGETPSSTEVMQAVAERSQAYPPREDSLALSAAAARYTLTSLESAKEIAREIRDSVKSAPADDVVDVASGDRHADIADALLG